MSSFQSIDSLEVSETFGANIQMPDQINFKALDPKLHSCSMPYLDFNLTYKQNTLRSKSRKTKRRKTVKTSTVKFKESCLPRTISSENVINFS